jgi:nucleoside-diphosphate-sugar epimerase
MKCLITGGFGDVGSILYQHYKSENYYISHFGEGMNGNAKRILHLAAKSPPASVEQILESNIVYLQEIVEYSIENRIEEMIFFSAVSVYGKQDREDVAESNGFVEPDMYGVSKLAGEKILNNCPLKVLSIRLPAVLGLRNRTNFLSRCYLKLMRNENVEISNADRLFNNFVSVKSLFRFLADFSFTKKYDVVNLAAGKEMTVLEIVKTMKDVLKSESEIVISERKQDFFNISTNKAISEYQFEPESPKESIEEWTEQREEYERNTVS